MNIVERGRAHLQSLVPLSWRTEWKHCPTCGGSHTNCWGGYKRHPWFLDGRLGVCAAAHVLRVSQDLLGAAGAAGGAQGRGSWYGRYMGIAMRNEQSERSRYRVFYDVDGEGGLVIVCRRHAQR